MLFELGKRMLCRGPLPSPLATILVVAEVVVAVATVVDILSDGDGDENT